LEQTTLADKRSYGDSCGIARALDLVGERWALLVVRELVLGAKRFTDLRAGLSGCSPDMLAQRLRDLEQAGVVRRRKLPPPVSARVYELTAWGRELEPVLLALGRWGSRSPLPPQPPVLGVDALAVALKTMFDPARAGGAQVTIGLRLEDEEFAVRVGGGAIDLRRGRPEAPAATLDADPATLAALLWHGYPQSEALAAGCLRIEGSRRAASRFLRLFPPAQPAPVTAA
jgi:DNA-binding HxlR family transcriptional regulator/putative sterol carrier protein